MKKVIPKKKSSEGSYHLAPFSFELNDLDKIIEECQHRKLWSLAFSIRHILDEIRRQRDLYKWSDE